METAADLPIAAVADFSFSMRESLQIRRGLLLLRRTSEITALIATNITTLDTFTLTCGVLGK
jgi:hypothetical protein